MYWTDVQFFHHLKVLYLPMIDLDLFFRYLKGLCHGNQLDRGYNTIKHCDKTAKTVLAVLSQLF